MQDGAGIDFVTVPAHAISLVAMDIMELRSVSLSDSVSYLDLLPGESASVNAEEKVAHLVLLRRLAASDVVILPEARKNVKDYLEVFPRKS